MTGFFSLAPTWFLLKLLVATAPRILLPTELLIAAMGPVSWLAMTNPRPKSVVQANCTLRSVGGGGR